MAKRNIVRHGFRSALWRVSPAVLLLLSLLFTAAVSTQAQGEDLNSEAPVEMPEPKVLSQKTLPNGVTQTTITIPVTQNTYVTSNKPSNNWCSSNWLRLGYSVNEGNGAERIFLRFDLSSIPSNASITSAKVRIYQHTITPSGDSEQMGVQSRHLASNWNQCAVTWTSHQPDWGGVIATSWIPNVIGWIEGDTTNLVKEWFSGQHPNNGVILIGDEREQERQRIFYSSRDTGGRSPYLIVQYTTYVDTQPPQVSVDPLPEWSMQRFTVKWSGTDPGGSGIDYYDVQYRVTGGTWNNWLNNTTATSAEFVGTNSIRYEFQARGVDKAGNVQPFPNTAQAWTTVDTIAPSATVDPLPDVIYSQAFTVSWSGQDNTGGSGIKCYDVQYREVGGSWVQPITCTTDDSVQITGAEAGSYELRARATDNAGNIQSWSATPQASTTVDTQLPVARIIPFASSITAADQITVQWQGEPSPTTEIKNYDVRYRFNTGSWVLWQSATTATTAVLTSLNEEDGLYCFEARARDTADRLGEYGGQQCIAVDRNPPFIEPKAYLPVMYTDGGG